mgnify:CR=1 FL=1
MCLDFEKNIFINCPFDTEYYHLLRPLIYTILYLGFNPRIALESSDSSVLRLDKICGLIEDSKYSIHDLSRLKSSKKNEFYRLNMPFELGIDYSSRRFKEELANKKFLILEKDSFNYMKAISDINGIDIKSHKSKPEEIIKCVRNWFVETVGLKNVNSPTQIWYDFNDFYARLYEIKTNQNFTKDEIDFMPIPEYMDEVRKDLKSLNPF